MYSVIAMLFASGALTTAWIRIRTLEFEVEFHKSDTIMVQSWYKNLQMEFERWKKVARKNYDRLTAEIVELKETNATLKKKNSTLKGQLTKERNRAASSDRL